MNNIEETYEAIVETGREMERVRQQLASCMIRGLVRRPFSLPRGLFKQAFSADLLSNKVLPDVKKWIEGNASDEVRAHRLYKCVVSDYSFACIAALTITTQSLNATDVKKLKMLHALKLEQIKSVDIKTMLAGLVGLGALVSKTLPKEIFEYFQWNYAFFQVVSTAILLCLLLYLTLTLSPLWLQYQRASGLHRTTGYILSYCEILSQEPETGRANVG